MRLGTGRRDRPRAVAALAIAKHARSRPSLSGVARNLIVLRGGMGSKQRRELREKMAAIPEDEERLLIATGRFIGEGFDDARLDTLFLTMPVSWRGTLVQYAGRLHRMHSDKAEVAVFDSCRRRQIFSLV